MSLATAPVAWRGFRAVRVVSGRLMIRDRTKNGLLRDHLCPGTSREAFALSESAHAMADSTAHFILPSKCPLDMAAQHRGRRLRALARLYEDLALYLESEEHHDHDG